MNKLATIFALFIAVTCFTSCSDNSTGPDEPDLGNASLTVSGDVEGQKEGIADLNSLDIGLYTWEIFNS